MNSERDFHLWFDELCFCPNITFAVEWPSDSKCLSQHLFIGSTVYRIHGISVSGWPGLALVAVTLFSFSFTSHPLELWLQWYCIHDMCYAETTPKTRNPFLHISMQMNGLGVEQWRTSDARTHSYFESTPVPSYLQANGPWPLLFRNHTLSFISTYANETLTTPLSKPYPFLHIYICECTLITPLSKPHPFLYIYICKWTRDKPLLRPPVPKPFASVFYVLM